jgi:hypothetical protein
MSGFNYEVNIKQYTAEDIEKDIKLWPDEVVRAAFISMTAAFYPENWPELKAEIEKELKNE